MTPAKFASDELYRTVYKRDESDVEPDWDSIDAKYAGRTGYVWIAQRVIPINPFSSMMWCIEEYVDAIQVEHTTPRDVDSDDPLETYDQPPCSCE